jgi:DNA (cytosine-5)-methyltransferase 1
MRVSEGDRHDTRAGGGLLKYLSCFSGIGGLESSNPPELFCETDSDCQAVLAKLHPGVPVFSDVQTLDPPKVEVVAGGWPCQDISIAGNQAGLRGLRSSLLLDMLRVAKSASAQTVVAENVPNLLRMREGREFSASLAAFEAAGYEYLGWRVVNAREFGLPQHRARLLIVASVDPSPVTSLFRNFPRLEADAADETKRDAAAGFYWTAGTHSINYSRGYIPTIKIGSSLGIASPPAVHYEDVVRVLSPNEALQLQGFSIDPHLFASATAAYKASGNAVPRPIGRWLLDGLGEEQSLDGLAWQPTQAGLWDDPALPVKHPVAGLSLRGQIGEVKIRASASKATNLIDFLDLANPTRLSPRASRGLLDRLSRSGQACPASLREALLTLAA